MDNELLESFRPLVASGVNPTDVCITSEDAKTGNQVVIKTGHLLGLVTLRELGDLYGLTRREPGSSLAPPVDLALVLKGGEWQESAGRSAMTLTDARIDRLSGFVSAVREEFASRALKIRGRAPSSSDRVASSAMGFAMSRPSAKLYPDVICSLLEDDEAKGTSSIFDHEYLLEGRKFYYGKLDEAIKKTEQELRVNLVDGASSHRKIWLKRARRQLPYLEGDSHGEAWAQQRTIDDTLWSQRHEAKLTTLNIFTTEKKRFLQKLKTAVDDYRALGGTMLEVDGSLPCVDRLNVSEYLDSRLPSAGDQPAQWAGREEWLGSDGDTAME